MSKEKVKCEFCCHVVNRESLAKHKQNNNRCKAHQQLKLDRAAGVEHPKLLKDRRPDMWKQIRPELNPDIDIENLEALSPKIVTWDCPDKDKNKCGHHIWKTTPISRVLDNAGCPFCNKKKFCECQSVAVLFPHLMKEFKQELNPGVDMYKLSPKSDKVIKWSCIDKKNTCGHHIWSVQLFHRTMHETGCPFCTRQKICACAEESFAVKRPDLLEEWDWERNDALGYDPYKLTVNSHTNAYWKCLDKIKNKCGHHVWRTAVKHRAGSYHNTKCPFCNRGEVCPCMSLEALYPELMVEYARDLNELKPSELRPQSGKKVWWRCIKGHIWYSVVYNRTRKRNPCNCPTCNESNLERKARQILDKLKITFDPQKSFDDCKYKKALSFDFFLPSYRAAIELDGGQHFEDVRFSKDQESDFEVIQIRDKIKNDYCRKNNIDLLRISYSEIDDMEVHIKAFLEELKKQRSGPIFMCCGLEYNEKK